MRRILPLAGFLSRELFRSLGGVLPVALTLIFHRVFFLYGGDARYLGSVGGVSMAVVCLLTTLLVADRANRAALYPLLARLPGRWMMLAAVTLASFLLTLLLSTLFVAVIVLSGSVPLAAPEAGSLFPRWLVLDLFAIALALHLSKLVSYRGSNLVTYAVLVLALATFEREPAPFPIAPDWVTGLLDLLIRPPFGTAIVEPGLFSAPRDLPAIFLTLTYTGLLFALAVWLYARKDLLASE